MTGKRRFSITESQAETVVKALKIALNQLYRIEDESPYKDWLQAEMEVLQFKLETYNFNKEN